MKKQILTLIIGILIGAIITTGVFLVIKSNEKSNMPSFDRSNFNMRERNNSETKDIEKKEETNTTQEETQDNN